jgi:hypothetical protein
MTNVIYVNLNEFPSLAAAETFAAKLQTVLEDRYEGDFHIHVDGSVYREGYRSGELFTGDIPEEWSREDYEAIAKVQL